MTRVYNGCRHGACYCIGFGVDETKRLMYKIIRSGGWYGWNEASQ
jgi:hypothetical protein